MSFAKEFEKAGGKSASICLEEAHKRLVDAYAAFDEVKVQYEEKNRQLSIAKGKLNDAMKAFDLAAEAMREMYGKDWDTEWNRRGRKGATAVEG